VDRRGIALACVKFVLASTLSCLAISHRLSEEAAAAVASSDQAFDNGELKRAMVEARCASDAAVMNSDYRRRSIERLEAIAVGSEATGRSKTALLAWSSLSAGAFSTAGMLWVHSKAEQRSVQHVAYLLDKVTGESTIATAREHPFARPLSQPHATRGISGPTLIIVAPLLGLVGFAVRSRRVAGSASSLKMPPLRALSLYFVAALCWCVGWIIA
jgi:hypothetical protein